MREFRNVVVILLLIAILIEGCFYVGMFLFTFLVWGPEYVNFRAIDPSYVNFPYRLWPSIFDWLADAWNYPEKYSFLIKIKLGFSLLAPFGVIVVTAWLLKDTLMVWRPFKKKEAIHGDARWATEKEIVKSGLRSKNGLLLGKDKKGFLIADGFQHALLFAPTGSGKGVGFVIPNLLFWKHSAVVHDIKLENYTITSGWRKKMGQEVFCWSPADPNGVSHCYNPLDWVSSKPGQMVDDVQKIANLLMPEQDFWVNEARSLFLGVVLYILAVPEKVKSFGEVVRTMRSDDVVYNLAVALDTMGKSMHQVAYMNIAAFLQKAEKERSGVISTLNSSLELWANPLIDTTTATSDFDFMQMKKRQITVYVGLTPDNLTRLQPLMQVFYQQATEFLCRHLPKPDEPYGVLFMMDEFPTLGKMEQFKTGIAYFRGYNVRLFLIIQDTEQLKGIYEEAGMNSFLSNATYRITFAANNIETANLISQLIGNKTVEQESLNKPKYFDLNPGARSLHVSETQRALLLPQEVIMLPRDEQILLIESTSPIKSKKIRYFEESFFKKRILPSIFVPTQEPFDPRKFAELKAKHAQGEGVDDGPMPEIESDNNQSDSATNNESFDSSPEQVKEDVARNNEDYDSSEDDEENFDDYLQEDMGIDEEIEIEDDDEEDYKNLK